MWTSSNLCVWLRYTYVRLYILASYSSSWLSLMFPILGSWIPATVGRIDGKIDKKESGTRIRQSGTEARQRFQSQTKCNDKRTGRGYQFRHRTVRLISRAILKILIWLSRSGLLVPSRQVHALPTKRTLIEPIRRYGICSTQLDL